ncbi:MAG: SIS domain-containing protein [Proteobacteria bacterium]|nr:SIS domain-containing protein [Pseudomonadota bacterium]
MDTIQYLEEIKRIVSDLPIARIDRVVGILLRAKRENNRVYVMGNGGSATTASHIAGDLNKTCGLRAMALTDSNYLITALANDEGYENIFSSQLKWISPERDIVLAFSGSGNSENIVKALISARVKGCLTIALTGFDGGKIKDIADICLVVPSEVMEQVEDIHLMIGHMLVTELKGI